MPIEIRTCSSAADLGRAISPIWHYFGHVPSDEQVAAFAAVLPAERVHAAWEGDGVVGGAGAFEFALTVPGGRVPAAGVTVVGVLPTHRRRGVLTALMRAQLDACRERGQPVAVLWPSEDEIYGRFGYGVASFSAEIDIPREKARGIAPIQPAASARLVPLEAAQELIAPVYARVAAQTPGMFARSPAWWQSRTLHDSEWRRRGGGRLQCVVLSLAGEPAAYAMYRLNSVLDRGTHIGSVVAVEALGESPEATRAIWRFLFDIDLMPRIKASLLPIDHPLLLLLAQPRHLHFTLREGLWLRIVDLEAAFAARPFAVDGVLAIEVSDEFCPWNGGRWLLGAGVPKRTADLADLACDIGALGSAFLGGFTWQQLARAMRVRELRPGALDRADAMFRAPCAPWCPEIF
jgi:predicted acetyltransferase